ncbi:uncharacterized protein METZ01_LOCUS365183, partial [marine metagenome]
MGIMSTILAFGHYFSFEAGQRPNNLTDSYTEYFFHAGTGGSAESIAKSKILSASALPLL